MFSTALYEKTILHIAVMEEKIYTTDMEDFEWIMMTILCVAVGFLLFYGATFFIQKGFEHTPDLNEAGFSETSRQMERIREENSRQIRQQREQQKQQQRDMEYEQENMRRLVEEYKRQNR